MSGGTAEVLLGTKGWRCGDWVGPFYPLGTKSGQMLALYARAFPTVEVESTAYALPAEAIVAEWRECVPPHFTFAMRVPQQVTHERRLQDTERVLRRFVDRVSALEDNLGPLLLQMPSGFRPSAANEALLARFVETLPSGLSWAVEFRQPGWMLPRTTEILRRSGVAVVLADARWIPRDMMPELALEPTARFTYLRWEGRGRKMTDLSRPQVDREPELRVWAQVVETVARRVERVYGYFDDQFEGHAPHSARHFQEMIGQEPVSPEALQEQAELF